jgi:5-methylcytosine-specific restriction protein A
VQKDPDYLAQRAALKEVAGRLVAVHRLRATARQLRQIVGDADFEQMQDMWAEERKRRRWSVAFPIVESYDIPTKPYARDVFDGEAMQRLFTHPSATLRPLNESERLAIADRQLRPRTTLNALIGIEDDIAAAERSEIDGKVSREIDTDLKSSAMEGMTEEQRRKVRLRAAWLANRFVIHRQKTGRLTCDRCSFDPRTLIDGSPVRARSLMDVHHANPMDEGRRVTTFADFAMLCPTCHRFEHALLRATAAGTKSH